jgi:hypothetical protein
MGGGRRWRLAVAGGVSVTLAVGVTAGVEYGAKSPGPAGKPAPAVLLADKAAAAAAAQPPVLPGQWVYTKAVNDTITPADSRQACAVKNGQGQVHDVFSPPSPACSPSRQVRRVRCGATE